MRKIFARIATIRQRVRIPKSVRVLRSQAIRLGLFLLFDYDCVVTPKRAAAKSTSPARVDREWFYTCLFRELAQFRGQFQLPRQC